MSILFTRTVIINNVAIRGATWSRYQGSPTPITHTDWWYV